MITREYFVMAPEGLHARPAKNLTKLAKRFASKMVLIKDGESFNPRSLISVITAEVSYQTTVTMEVAGDDEQECVEALDFFFNEDIMSL